MKEKTLKENKSSWIIVRDMEVCKVVNNRKEGIKYIKDLLKQTLKDLNKQDKTNEYDYEIYFPALSLQRVFERETFLGL